MDLIAHQNMSFRANSAIDTKCTKIYVIYILAFHFDLLTFLRQCANSLLPQIGQNTTKPTIEKKKQKNLISSQ